MLQHRSKSSRWTVICVAVAIGVSLPGIATAGDFGKARIKLHNLGAGPGKAVHKTLAKVGTDVPVGELMGAVKELRLMEQFRDTLALIREMEADYQAFSGGGFGCKSECKAFRKDLKDLFDSLLALTAEAPVINGRGNLTANLERLADLIDFVPPRALYLMWQAMGDQAEHLQATLLKIRRALRSLPPVVEISDVATAVADSRVCGWVDDERYGPVIEWIQAELEALSWFLKTVEGYIPDITIGGEAGGEAGAAVANVTASATTEVKISDPIKIALNVAATVPEAINVGLKVNMARAKMVCAASGLLAN